MTEYNRRKVITKKNYVMRIANIQNNRVTKVMIILSLYLFTTVPGHAQKFIDELQKKQQGQGTVTVTQSAEITELVNGKPLPDKPATVTTTKEAENKTTATDPKTPETKKEITEKKSDDSSLDIPTIDTRKKVMRGAYKITGYRVQVYSGGNSRADRIKAEETGSKMKTNFPDQPIYVHFYSPRWICRMGNFKTYGEAQDILRQVKKLGYPQACIVKGKITVQD